MKAIGLLLALLLVGFAIASYHAQDVRDPAVDLLEPTSPEVAQDAATNGTRVLPEGPAVKSGARFDVDRHRLYDVSYLADPQLIAYADSVDRTPQCVLVATRENVTPDTSEDPACFSVSQQAHKIGFTVGGLSDMADEELLMLAETDPNANLALAYRHFEDAETVSRRVERAMALSGKAGPVQLLQATDDVPEGVHALEVLLTSEELGRRIDPVILAGFRSGLTDELQALAQERAHQRASRIKQLRKDLVGEPWDVN